MLSNSMYSFLSFLMILLIFIALWNFLCLKSPQRRSNQKQIKTEQLYAPDRDEAIIIKNIAHIKVIGICAIGIIVVFSITCFLAYEQYCSINDLSMTECFLSF